MKSRTVEMLMCEYASEEAVQQLKHSLTQCPLPAPVINMVVGPYIGHEWLLGSVDGVRKTESRSVQIIPILSGPDKV